MKTALCAFALCAGALPLLAAPDTAYQALRTVSAQRGDDVLKHVIEVQGVSGVPQPNIWRVVLDDPAARGGVREIDVAHGKITAEHTPVRAYGGSSAGALIDFHKLDLDSSGVFTGDGADASPVWVIHMMDASHHSVGTLSVAADTGAIVMPLAGGPSPDVVNSGSSSPPPPPSYTVQETDHDNLYNSSAQEPPPVRQEDDSDTEDTHGLRVGHRIKTAILSAGESLKNFVTGQSQNH